MNLNYLFNTSNVLDNVWIGYPLNVLLRYVCKERYELQQRIFFALDSAHEKFEV